MKRPRILSRLIPSYATRPPDDHLAHPVQLPVARALSAGQKYRGLLVALAGVAVLMLVVILVVVLLFQQQQESEVRGNGALSRQVLVLLTQVKSLTTTEGTDRARTVSETQALLRALQAQDADNTAQERADLIALLRALESGSPTVTFSNVPVPPTPATSSPAASPSSFVSRAPVASPQPSAVAPSSAPRPPVGPSPSPSTLGSVVCSLTGVCVLS
jgi:hypothetical protein